MTYGYEDTDYKTKNDPSTGYAFNAALSTFFCRIRDVFKEELQEMYVRLESAGAWNAESIIQEFDTAQAEFPEELWRVDIERKYLRSYREGSPRFLQTMMNGKKKYQRRQFMRNQEKYMATKFFGNVAISDQIMFRCNTPTEDIVVKPNYTLHITPYADMYIDVLFGATYRTQVRAEAGKQYDIECPFSTMDDTAVLIYCSSMIQSLGDLSACYIHDNDFSKASKLKELIIGNATEGYKNSFLTNLGIGNNALLETLDIQNTPNLEQAIDLSKCGNLKSLYAFGSGINGVTFADRGLIELAELPDINALTMKNLIYLENLDIASFENMTTLVAENCGTIDLVNIITNSPKLNRARLIGIDWRLEDSSLIDRIYKMGGIDNNGYNVPIAVLSGKVYFPVARQQMLDLYAKAWPDLEVSYETLMPQFTATFKNHDGSVLDVQYVDIGKDAIDPTTRPENPIPVPTKPSTVSSNFTFSGWDINFTNITSNIVITAQFTETVREYTVRYVSGSYTLQEVKGAYGSYVSYTGDIPTDTSMESAYTYRLFKRWDNSGYVDGDKTIRAVYDEFTYTDGCFDSMDTSTMTPVQLYAMVKVGKEADVVEIKDTITIGMGNDYSYDDIEDNLPISEEIVFMGTNHMDSGIRLLETDSNWTIAIDYKFDEGNKSGSVLAQCYQGDGSNGFKLGFSTYPRITWGTSSLELAQVGKRDMLVIRHVKGESRVHIYRGNLPSDIVDYSTLSSNRSPVANSSLVFGCAKADDGTYENYGKGSIYWCKVWHADLGDDACKTLAMWTHEKIILEAYGFKKYYLSDNSGQRSAVSFIATHLLANNMMLGNSSNNAGGWATSSLNLFLNNRFYNSLPYDWRKVIRQVKVPSTIGNKSHETSTSNCFVAIPSVSELDASMNYEPYDAEGSPIPFILSEADRMRKHANGVADEYFTRSPNIEYTTYFMYITKDGRSNGFAYAYSERGVLLELSI